jgi:plasmid stabilization system protein ParE
MAKNKIFISEVARKHLKESFDRYEREQLSLGKEFRNEIREYFNKLITGNVDYQKYNEIIRKVRLHRFPYYIYYKRETNRIVILAVLHNKRNPDEIRNILNDK